MGPDDPLSELPEELDADEEPESPFEEVLPEEVPPDVLSAFVDELSEVDDEVSDFDDDPDPLEDFPLRLSFL